MFLLCMCVGPYSVLPFCALVQKAPFCVLVQMHSDSKSECIWTKKFHYIGLSLPIVYIHILWSFHFSFPVRNF